MKLPYSGWLLGIGAETCSFYPEHFFDQWGNMCDPSLENYKAQWLSHGQRSYSSDNCSTSGCCPAQGSSWASMRCGDGRRFVGGGSVCGSQSFSGYDDSKCSSSSSPGFSPARLGSPGHGALWQD